VDGLIEEPAPTSPLSQENIGEQPVPLLAGRTRMNCQSLHLRAAFSGEKSDIEASCVDLFYLPIKGGACHLEGPQPGRASG